MTKLYIPYGPKATLGSLRAVPKSFRNVYCQNGGYSDILQFLATI